MVLLKWLLIVVSLIILSILAISQPEIQYFLFELLLNFTVENSNFLSDNRGHHRLQWLQLKLMASIDFDTCKLILSWSVMCPSYHTTHQQ